MTKNESIIYCVRFERTPEGEKDKVFFFGSLSAIFDKFTPKQLGCSLRELWDQHMKEGDEYFNLSVTITKSSLYRKKQRR